MYSKKMYFFSQHFFPYKNEKVRHPSLTRQRSMFKTHQRHRSVSFVINFCEIFLFLLSLLLHFYLKLFQLVFFQNVFFFVLRNFFLFFLHIYIHTQLDDSKIKQNSNFSSTIVGFFYLFEEAKTVDSEAFYRRFGSLF